MLERERIIEIVAAVFSVGLMLAVMYWIGLEYGDTNAGGLNTDGGQLLVGAIIGFIVLLTVVGIVLAFVLNPSVEADTGEENSA